MPELEGPGAPQYFADQLTLFQPWGADSAHPLLVAPLLLTIKVWILLQVTSER